MLNAGRPQTCIKFSSHFAKKDLKICTPLVPLFYNLFLVNINYIFYQELTSTNKPAQKI